MDSSSGPKGTQPRSRLPIRARIRLPVRLQLERAGVDAVALPGRRGTIVEHVAQVTVTPFTGRYHDTKPPGRYRCAGCGPELFSSETKFDSGTGWPGFTQPVRPSAVREEADPSFGMVRTEVMHARPFGALLAQDAVPLRVRARTPSGLRHVDLLSHLQFLLMGRLSSLLAGRGSRRMSGVAWDGSSVAPEVEDEVCDPQPDPVVDVPDLST